LHGLGVASAADQDSSLPVIVLRKPESAKQGHYSNLHSRWPVYALGEIRWSLAEMARAGDLEQMDITYAYRESRWELEMWRVGEQLVV